MTPNQMLYRAKAILRDLKDRFPELVLLDKVRFEVSKRLTRSAGKAWHKTGLVRLSAKIFARPENEYDFDNTVLHEIAHILTPKEHHSWRWRRMHKRIGGNGKRTHSLVWKSERRKFPVWCKRCGRQLTVGVIRYRRLVNGTPYHHVADGGSLTVTPVMKEITCKS